MKIKSNVIHKKWNQNSLKNEIKIHSTRVEETNAAKFYGTAKLHKFPTFVTVYQVPLRPIISNIGTACYQLAKIQAMLLLALTKS